MDYVIKKGKRGRRNISITVKNGGVFVYVPDLYDFSPESLKKVDEMVRRNHKWIENKLAENVENVKALNDVIKDSSLMLFGSAVQVVSIEKGRGILLKEGEVYIPNKLIGDARKKAICRWYKKIAVIELEKRLIKISDTINMKYSDFSLTLAKGRWGSCSSKQEIKLNYRLVALPDKLIEYVIVHELCHTVVMSHNAKFWGLVERILPDYKKRKREIKNYNEIMNII